MKVSATIRVEESAEDILKLFKTEDATFKNERASFSLKKSGKCAVFDVVAEDATALRAMLDAIVKGLKIYEVSKEIK